MTTESTPFGAPAPAHTLAAALTPGAVSCTLTMRLPRTLPGLEPLQVLLMEGTAGVQGQPRDRARLPGTAGAAGTVTLTY